MSNNTNHTSGRTSINGSQTNHSKSSTKAKLNPANEYSQTNSSGRDGASKSHKVGGKNKQSSQQLQFIQQKQQNNSSSNRQRASTNQKNPSSPNRKSPENPATTCLTLNEFSNRALELKADINRALEKQEEYQIIDQPVEVVKLKEDILKLSGLGESQASTEESSEALGDAIHENDKKQETGTDEKLDDSSLTGQEKGTTNSSDNSLIRSYDSQTRNEKDNPVGYKSDSILTLELDKSSTDNSSQSIETIKTHKSISKKSIEMKSEQQATSISKSNDVLSEVFEPLDAKLDFDSKIIALKSSLQKHFVEVPHILEPICCKLAHMSEQNDQLSINCENYQYENQKLNLIKQKLENLCRELQKSNNSIRIESLDLIKLEQSKAKEQTTKIQSTLSGVIKLFDENQQRNMNLRQENQELQTKLKSLLEHCDNWEKSVEAALRQRDIENRLLKTELAKANLLRNEEKEKYLSEKQELLQLLSMMQEQRHRIEGQEAKLRSDLSSYASKYDECQAVISKGMSRFQSESKKMLKQIEKSKQDYKVLLTKYESNNRRMSQLLEEKQHWDKSMSAANKKIETLEKLCRALRDSKGAKGPYNSRGGSRQKSHEKQDEDVGGNQLVIRDSNDSMTNQINEDTPKTTFNPPQAQPKRV